MLCSIDGVDCLVIHGARIARRPGVARRHMQFHGNYGIIIITDIEQDCSSNIKDIQDIEYVA